MLDDWAAVTQVESSQSRLFIRNPRIFGHGHLNNALHWYQRTVSNTNSTCEKVAAYTSHFSKLFVCSSVSLEKGYLLEIVSLTMQSRESFSQILFKK